MVKWVGGLTMEGLPVDVDRTAFIASPRFQNELSEFKRGLSDARLAPPEVTEAVEKFTESKLQKVAGLPEAWVRLPGVGLDGIRVRDSVLVFARSPSAWLTHTPVTFLQSVPAPKDADRLGFTPEPGHSRDLLQTIANVKARSLNDFQKHMGRTGAKRSKMEELIGTIEAELTEFFGVQVFFRTDAETSSLLVDFGAVEEMTMSQAPDGLRSVIGWLVDVIMMTHLLRPESANPMHEEMVILLDEPETHLHPGWQRKIIPLAQRMLPNAQIIVATHSPFVVMSVNEGWIHRLEPQTDGTVIALKPQKASPGDSYPFVTDVVMGVPEWFDPESERLLAEFKELKRKALDGDASAAKEAGKRLDKLAARGEELSAVVGAERAQLERLLAQSVNPAPEMSVEQTPLKAGSSKKQTKAASFASMRKPKPLARKQANTLKFS